MIGEAFLLIQKKKDKYHAWRLIMQWNLEEPKRVSDSIDGDGGILKRTGIDWWVELDSRKKGSETHTCCRLRVTLFMSIQKLSNHMSGMARESLGEPQSYQIRGVEKRHAWHCSESVRERNHLPSPPMWDRCRQSSFIKKRRESIAMLGFWVIR